MHEVSRDLICGTQPRNPEEIEELAKQHGVSVILNLQQDKDMQYWGIDWSANQQKYRELGIKLIRNPVSSSSIITASCQAMGLFCQQAAVGTAPSAVSYLIGLIALLQAIDFDPHSLRKMLPSAVKAVQSALVDGKR